MGECGVCCLKYTDKLREKIACPACDFGSCLKCVQKYLLDGTDGYDPKCMQCGVPWNQEYVDQVLPKTFRFGPLKQKRQETLFDKERALLPATMTLVDRELQIRKQQELVKALAKEKAECDLRSRRLQIELRQIGGLIEDMRNNRATTTETERRQFIRACPAPDCRGYLSTQWKCELCQIRVCNECHEVKDQDVEHVCNPDNLASARATMRETKPCPSCGTRIFKIDGCDQMFCTMEGCHTAFSWRSGRKETGRIHNPHYYEWLRRTQGAVPREPGDVPGGDCRQIPDYHAVRRHYRLYATLNNIWPDIDKFHRLLLHIQATEMPPTVPDGDRYADLRIRYLLKEIDEAGFKKELFRRHKNTEKQEAIRQLIQMFVDVSRDILHTFMQSTSVQTFDDLDQQSQTLRAYYNGQMEDIARRFNASFYRMIDHNWMIQYKRLGQQRVQN